MFECKAEYVHSAQPGLSGWRSIIEFMGKQIWSEGDLLTSYSLRINEKSAVEAAEEHLFSRLQVLLESHSYGGFAEKDHSHYLS